jgi:hypothetical protein
MIRNKTCGDDDMRLATGSDVYACILDSPEETVDPFGNSSILPARFTDAVCRVRQTRLGDGI